MKNEYPYLFLKCYGILEGVEVFYGVNYDYNVHTVADNTDYISGDLLRRRSVDSAWEFHE